MSPELVVYGGLVCMFTSVAGPLSVWSYMCLAYNVHLHELWVETRFPGPVYRATLVCIIVLLLCAPGLVTGSFWPDLRPTDQSRIQGARSVAQDSPYFRFPKFLRSDFTNRYFGPINCICEPV